MRCNGYGRGCASCRCMVGHRSLLFWSSWLENRNLRLSVTLEIYIDIEDRSCVHRSTQMRPRWCKHRRRMVLYPFGTSGLGLSSNTPVTSRSQTRPPGQYLRSYTSEIQGRLERLQIFDQVWRCIRVVTRCGLVVDQPPIFSESEAPPQRNHNLERDQSDPDGRVRCLLFKPKSLA